MLMHCTTPLVQVHVDRLLQPRLTPFYTSLVDMALHLKQPPALASTLHVDSVPHLEPTPFFRSMGLHYM